MSASTNTSEGSFVTDSYSSYYRDDNFTDIPMYEESDQVDLHALIWPAGFTFTVLAANALSLTAFCVEKRLHTYNNLFIINLTVADFLTGFALMTTTAHTYLGYFPFSSQLFGKIQDGIINALFTVSNLAVVLICVDRHRATYDPINHFMSRNTRKAAMISTIPWLISFSFWIPYATIWDIIVGTDTGNHCILWYIRSPNAYVIANLITFFIPFILIANFNFSILFKIFKTVGGKNVRRKFNVKGSDSRPDSGPRSLEDGPSADVNTDDFNDNMQNSKRFPVEADGVPGKSSGHQGNKQKEESNERRQESRAEMRKATRTLIFIVIIFVVTWFPHSLISLLYAIHPPLVAPGLPRPYRLFFRWLSYSNSLFNPMSYVVSQPLFRFTVARLLTCRYFTKRRRP